MLSYKMIKRKYKLTDANIADYFGYKNRIAFVTSTGKNLLTTYLERVYDRYAADGVKGAADYIKDLSFPGSPDRQKRYKDGLYEFVDTVNFQNKKGKYVDPKLGPRARMYKYKKQ